MNYNRGERQFFMNYIYNFIAK